MSNLKIGDCEHCKRNYSYRLYHSGFSDNSYAYCDSCGMLCVVTYGSDKVPEWPANCPQYEEICVDIESLLQPCECGGSFRKGAAPRCPSCAKQLSAAHASRHIEQSSPGTANGWRWQGNWHGRYCIAIESSTEKGKTREIINPFI